MTLHKAAEEGKVDLVRSFLDKGEDVNSENADSKTALDLATSKGHLDVVRLLIDRRAQRWIHVIVMGGPRYTRRRDTDTCRCRESSSATAQT
jgi:ankyrin repeat protein